MYDVDLKVTLIIKDRDLPKDKAISGMVRSLDLVPTLLDLADISSHECDFDGISILTVIETGKVEGGRCTLKICLGPVVKACYKRYEPRSSSTSEIEV